jgi:hypothetical protein
MRLSSRPPAPWGEIAGAKTPAALTTMMKQRLQNKSGSPNRPFRNWFKTFTPARLGRKQKRKRKYHHEGREEHEGKSTPSTKNA